MPTPAEKINENNTKVIRMTSGQKSYLPNEFFDACSRTRIPGEQMQVLMAIVRKTWCWGKDEDKISLSQLASMTGLSRRNALRAIQNLESRKMISVVRNDNSEAQTIEINTNYSQWSVLSKLTTVVKNDNKGVVKTDTKVLSKLTTTKDTIQKTIKNNSSCPDSLSQDAEPKNLEPEKPAKKAKTLVFDESHLSLADLLHDEIVANKPDYKFESGYRERWADSARMMIQRDNRTVEDIQAVIRWCQSVDFWKPNICSIPKLREKFDRLQMEMKSGRRGSVIPFQQPVAVARPRIVTSKDIDELLS